MIWHTLKAQIVYVSCLVLFLFYFFCGGSSHTSAINCLNIILNNCLKPLLLILFVLFKSWMLKKFHLNFLYVENLFYLYNRFMGWEKVSSALDSAIIFSDNWQSFLQNFCLLFNSLLLVLYCNLKQVFSKLLLFIFFLFFFCCL